MVLGTRTDVARERTVRGVPDFIVALDKLEIPYSPDAYAAIIADQVKQRQAGIVLMAATATGKDVMPRVAQLLGVSLAQDCTEVSLQGADLVFTRPLYGGKILADVILTSWPILATIRPRSIPAEDRVLAPDCVLPNVITPEPLTIVETVSSVRSGRPDVTEAEIVVSGGRGMGGPENWDILEDLVDALGPKATLACSRPVSDDGWRPHDEHVGQTGRSIAPDLYIACGISGAIQHVAGIAGSKCIVAINRDAEAPIFKVADYGIVGDLFEVVPALAKAVRNLA